jgi:hypothetical protein
MVIESIQAGAKDFIVKPFQADRVIGSCKESVVVMKELLKYFIILGFFAVLCCSLILATKFIGPKMSYLGASKHMRIVG